jgi:hypothetical protein
VLQSRLGELATLTRSSQSETAHLSLRRLCARTDGGLQSIALAAWALVQARLTGQREVSFGAVLTRDVAGRPARVAATGAEPLASFQVRVEPEQSIGRLLEEVATSYRKLHDGQLPSQRQGSPDSSERALPHRVPCEVDPAAREGRSLPPNAGNTRRCT